MDKKTLICVSIAILVVFILLTGFVLRPNEVDNKPEIKEFIINPENPLAKEPFSLHIKATDDDGLQSIGFEVKGTSKKEYFNCSGKICEHIWQLTAPPNEGTFTVTSIVVDSKNQKAEQQKVIQIKSQQTPAKNCVSGDGVCPEGCAYAKDSDCVNNNSVNSYDYTYIVEHLSSKNISIISSPYSMVKAWYRNNYGEEFRHEDINILSFTTFQHNKAEVYGDYIALFFDYPSGETKKAKITGWEWHPHFVDIEFSDGTKEITGKLTQTGNSVVLELTPTKEDIIIVFAAKNSGVDGGGIQVEHTNKRFHITTEKDSSYSRVGAFIDVKFSNDAYSSYSVDANTVGELGERGIANTSFPAIKSQLDGPSTDLNNIKTKSKPNTNEYGIAAVNYNNGWSSPLVLSVSYSAESFSDAESNQYSDYNKAESDCKNKWGSYFEKMPFIEPFNELYWKSWAIIGINGEDHRTMPEGKYDFVDTIEEFTGKKLGRSVIGQYSVICGGTPRYNRFWPTDHLWSPALLVYSGQEDVLHSMVQGIYSIYEKTGMVPDSWMPGKANAWDNYDHFIYGDTLDMSYHMTGYEFYQNKKLLAGSVKEQYDIYKGEYGQLFDVPGAGAKTFGLTPSQAEPLSSWRSFGVTSLLQILSEMDSSYKSRHDELLSASEDYFWNSDYSSWNNRNSDGTWSENGLERYNERLSIDAVYFNPQIYKNKEPLTWEESIRVGNSNKEIPMSLIIETILGDPAKAADFRKRIFKMSDYFPEGLDENFQPGNKGSALHLIFGAEAVILAKIGMIPYAKTGYDGFVVIPGIDDVKTVKGLHFRDSIININYHGSGLNAEIYLNGKKVESDKRNFIPFTALSNRLNEIDVYYQ